MHADRRSFIQNAFRLSLSGAGVLAGLGCASSPSGRAGADDPELAAALRNGDAGLAEAGRTSLLRAAVPELGDGPLPGELAHQEQVQIASMRSAFAVGWFRELPERLQAHAAVQARLQSVLGDMETSVAGNTAFLRRLKPAEIRKRSGILHGRPDARDRVNHSIRARCAAADVAPELRAKLLRAQAEASGRLQRDPVAAVGGHVRTVRRVAALSGDQAELERRLAAEVARESLFHEASDGGPAIHARVAQVPSSRRLPTRRYQSERHRPSRYDGYDRYGSSYPGRPNSGRGLLKAAGVLFGLSLAATGIGLIVPDIGVGVALVCGGVLMALVALGLLIAGAIVYSVRR